MKLLDLIRARSGDLVLEKWQALLELVQSQAILPGDGILLTSTSMGTAVSVSPNYFAFKGKWHTRLMKDRVYVRAGMVNGLLPEGANEYQQEIEIHSNSDTFWVVIQATVERDKLKSFVLKSKTELIADGGTVLHPVSRVKNNQVFHISYFDLQLFHVEKDGHYNYYFCPV